MSASVDSPPLAIQGAAPAKQRPDPPMFPGGMAVDEEEEAAVLEVLRSKRLFRYNSPYGTPSRVDELERAFAAKKGVQHALGVTSGTAALICGLQAIGVGPGDEVIVPAYTWIATATAVLAVGAVPIVAEVDETLLLDPADVARKVTPYTKAVIPVHMRGAPCRMDAILEVARAHQLKVVEDCAQANGASYQGKEVGAFGDVGCFSLQFNKIITCGEGGMVVTDSPDLWERAAMYHDAGATHRRHAEDRLLWGVNFRMPELLAAVALVQLRKLDRLLAAMRARKQMLKSGIADMAQRKGVQFRELADPAGDTAIALIFFMPTAERAKAVSEALRAENIGASVLYDPAVRDYHVYAHWVPVMQQRAWSAGGDPWRWANRPIEYREEMCPRSLELLGRAVHLNVSPLLTNEDVEETIEGVNRVLHVLA
ncbi:MAG TPA: DegT/DnrJ/EryC1/StrS family aminotransferase [Caldilineaceae bacterium]|nr:DegT/DnrJ/EryC1/StrS family aminotransferase [Caldilineaceae bacterium]